MNVNGGFTASQNQTSHWLIRNQVVAFLQRNGKTKLGNGLTCFWVGGIFCFWLFFFFLVVCFCFWGQSTTFYKIPWVHHGNQDSLMKVSLRDGFANTIMSVTLITENHLAYSPDLELYLVRNTYLHCKRQWYTQWVI